jgi:hypothetical protein
LWCWLAAGFDDRPNGDGIEPSSMDLACERLGGLLRSERLTVGSRLDLCLIGIRCGE